MVVNLFEFVDKIPVFIFPAGIEFKKVTRSFLLSAEPQLHE